VTTRYRIVRYPKGNANGDRLYMAKPFAKNCQALREPRWTVRRSHAFVWATRAAAERHLKPTYEGVEVHAEVEEFEVDGPLPEPYALSKDPTVPGIVMEVGCSKEGRRRTFRSVG